MKCHFCDKELPEPPAQHVIHASGRLHQTDDPPPLYPVCFACMKQHKLQPRELRRVP